MYLRKKNIYLITIVCFITLFFFGTWVYKKIYSNNVLKTTSIYISSSDNFTSLKEKITPIVKNIEDFEWVAARKNFTKLKSGRYILTKGMSNNQIVNLLRIGNQTAVKISFNNQNTLEKLASRIAAQLETDSISLLSSFTDSIFLTTNNLTKKSVLQIFLPNSYQCYWNISAEKFRDKMLLEYHRYWNKNRLEKAKKINLTKEQVITLASIVQKETAKTTERPTVAGLYLNRLKNGWPLQADPTIIYCVKEEKGQDYIVKRVLKKDLEINSPYNTYLNKGLPPTLIAMPDISAIEAVLNAEKHNYFYMCASIHKIGYHEFSTSLAQHNRNAAIYQQWLNKNGVHR